MRQVIDMVRVDKEILTPEEYIKLKETNPNSIKSTRIVPCTFGKDGFGKIEVTYHAARYVVGGVQ
ncbi:MAG: hypothetical protein Q4E34_01435 [Synergistaceae bacterium]|nr:hypothetical protein [Synergistaceae bacterium]